MSTRSRNLITFPILIAALGLLAWWFWPRQDTKPENAPDATAELDDPRLRVSAIGKPKALAKPTGLVFQRPVGSISGTITEPGGTPLPGASVCAWLEHRDAPVELTRTPRCTTSGADGYYRLADLPPINVTVSASAEQHVPATWRERPGNDRIRLLPGQERKDVNLELAPGGVAVQGIVRDIAGGVVEDALLIVSSDFRGRRSGRSIVATDAEGRFTAWAEEGEVWIEATADGYGTGWQSGVAPSQSVELYLTPESILVGRVVRAGTQEPVANASVSTYGGEWAQTYAITDAEGRFRIDGLPPGTYHPSVTTEGGYGSAPRPIPVGLAQSSDEVVIEIHPVATVAGLIVGDDGPCTNGSATLSPTVPSGRSYVAAAEPDGSLRIRGIHPGTYTPTVSCEGHVTRTDFGPLVIERAAIEGVRWVLTRGVVLEGMVANEGGTAIADAEVRANLVQADPKGRPHQGWTTSDASGRFTFEGLVVGKYKLEVQAKGYVALPEPVEVEVGEQGAEAPRIVLTRGGTIEGDVVDTHDKPVVGANVRASGSKRGGAGVARDDGTFRIDGLAPGSYRVIASRGWTDDLRAPGDTDDAVKGVPIEVAANAVAKVRIVVEALDGRITGRVVDARGASVSDAFIDWARESDSAAAAAGRSVTQSRWGGWDRKPVLTDDVGTFEIDGLARGRYTLRASRRGGGEAVAEHVEIGSTGVVLTIRETGSIAGRVVLAGGGVPESFDLFVNDRSQGYSQRHEFYRTDGVFEMTNLPAGQFELAVRSVEGDSTTNVTLTSGETREDLEIELAAKVDVRGRVIDLESGEAVPGIHVTLPGAGNFLRLSGASDDDPSLSDASGHFLVRGVAAGYVQLFFTPRTRSDDGYTSTSISIEIPSGAREHDVGDVRLTKPRRKPNDDRGDLGLKIKEGPPGSRPHEVPLMVAFVRPGGPAQAAGLAAGDVIESVGGHGVTGRNRYLYGSLVNAPVGTKLVFGLAGGRSVEIVVGPAP